MRLYVGGKSQGKTEYVKAQTGLTAVGADMSMALTSPAINGFHNIIREVINAGLDADDYTAKLIKLNPDVVIISDEVGMGIVPVDKHERVWREAVGRALCVIAREAEVVERVICGIGVKIK